MPGVEVVANVFQGLRQAHMIWPLGLELQVVSGPVLVLLLGLILSYLIDYRQRLLALLLVAAPVLVSALLYGSTRLWFEPMSSTLALAVAFVVLQWRELRQVVRAFSAERMRATVTLRTLAEAVITIDNDGSITYLNPAAAYLLGTSSARAVGRNVDEVFRAVDEERGRVFSFLEANNDIDRLPNYWVLDAGDREQRTVRASFARLDDPRPGGRGLIVTVTDVTQERHLTRQIHYQASHDPLTDLPNRMLLADRLEQAIARAARANSNLAVMFTDLDDFKKVNDSLGHVAGDALLRAVASSLNQAVRLEDTVGRLGGDEFVVLVEHLRNEAAALTVAEKLAAAVRKPHKISGQEVYVTTSIGVCFYPKDGKSADELLRNADTAMYSAKAGGGDAVAAFDQTMKQNAIERFTLEMDLQRALVQHELCVFYQPVIDLRTGAIVGFEALIRWRHPRRGLLLPGRFIPMAEQSGLIVSIGEWVIRTACSDLAAWLKDCDEHLRVAVNLSPRQLQDVRLPVVVENALQETGLATGCLELEITEEVLMSDAYGGISTLNRLREIGLKVAIDDFGTGYSSFSYLKRFSASRLKIDRSFVKDVTANADDAAIVEAIVAMAKLLRVAVTAEGVESLEQADFFRRLGCAEAQGLYFGKPLEANQVRRMLRRVHLGRNQKESGSSGDGSKPQVFTDSQ
jgi:diguanylate cyclase (GGDEF)-like protein/PAS domain S-box-containing protein